MRLFRRKAPDRPVCRVFQFLELPHPGAQTRKDFSLEYFFHSFV